MHFRGLYNSLDRVAANPYLASIRDGMTLTLPLVVAGTVALLINHFPLEAYQNLMRGLFGVEWKHFGLYINMGTFGVISVIVALSISYSLAEEYNRSHPALQVPPILSLLVMFGCFISIMEPTTLEEGGFALPIRWLGVSGLLVAILTALGSSVIFRFFLRFRRLRMLFLNSGSGSMAQVMDTLVPAVLTIFVFSGIKLVLKLLSIDNANDLIYTFLATPLSESEKDTLFSANLFVFIRHLLWFFGAHGSNILEPAMQSLYGPNLESNIALFLSTGSPVFFEHSAPGGEAVKILTKPFFDCYTSIGGSGSTFSLIIALLVFGRDKGVQKIARFSILPGIFNINEIILFGIPLVLNPIYLLPFLFVPLVSTVMAYAACYAGLVPVAVHDVPWNMPFLFNAYYATESYSAVVLQVASIAISSVLFAPFVLLDNRIRSEMFSGNFKKLMSSVSDDACEANKAPRIMTLPEPLGGLARSLASDLSEAVAKRQVFMEYQPQVNSSTGTTYGVESLMRWHHPDFGRIPPSLFIPLAEESGDILSLGLWGMEESISQMAHWRREGITDVTVSVNISVAQLYDKDLPDKILEILERYHVPADCLKIEVTESIALNSEMKQHAVLDRLYSAGVRLAIDDFGMGHSSLTYLKQFAVSSLKLDASLTRDVLSDKSSQEIIQTIAELCHTLNIELIGEFVEDEPHLLKLRSLGCHNIQGYFYSPPLGARECLDFITSKHTSYGLPASCKANALDYSV